MGYMDENDPDYYEDRRRAQEDMREVMRDERRYNTPGGGDWTDDPAEFFVMGGIIVAFVIFGASAVLYFAAGWLDAHFGWGLTGWLNSILPPFMHK